MAEAKKTIDSAARARTFLRLSLGAVATTFLMIVIGAVTRVTESGYGCGPYWPSCNGLLIPEFENVAVVIEYGHRVFALIVGFFAVGVGMMAWRNYRAQPLIFIPAALGFVLFFVQSAIGALTVVIYTHAAHWISVMIHLGNSMFLLAAFIAAYINGRRLLLPQAETRMPRFYIPPLQLALATALSFMVAMVGAAVAGQNATKACIGYPLCGGEIFPFSQGAPQMVHMLHRLIAGALGILLVLMLWQARADIATALRRALQVAFAIYLAQAALGAVIVLVDDRDWLVMARSLHVFFAAATWAAMIAASVHAWLQRLPRDLTVKSQPTSDAARSAITSS
ncbi:MAG: COX15/CtaA family protein [Anaerolineae bacterium]|nr:COX15/CtaA family protein [Anaerolineae bacterium]